MVTFPDGGRLRSQRMWALATAGVPLVAAALALVLFRIHGRLCRIKSGGLHTAGLRPRAASDGDVPTCPVLPASLGDRQARLASMLRATLESRAGIEMVPLGGLPAALAHQLVARREAEGSLLPAGLSASFAFSNHSAGQERQWGLATHSLQLAPGELEVRPLLVLMARSIAAQLRCIYCCGYVHFSCCSLPPIHWADWWCWEWVAMVLCT